ncbi:MAG: ComEA family DNA-binding protein [Armatimonadetes bacterium]|nr:ComEA family DNA-binding protein [Armatimonadota bacterium]NIM24739.1 ComEA family DNA-binding protein [Armatimonadota bacterium]NIM68619.1 ComEA family DNA-binding protein [Armatimonadota bacterium]NIM77136.1 ComEA family DNA-binding protein [Armatimonadota bacterium]NIN06813.1 ComEA family DNA-binding protein [Armatimonadota bacterium]
MVYFSRWEKVAFIVLLLALAAGVGVLLYGRGQLAAMDSGEPFFVDVPAESRRAATMLVHVSGAVANPGVYHLTRGSRVHEAIEEAGGASPEADLGALNLAEVLRDGQKVEVPTEQASALAPQAAPSIERQTSASQDLVSQRVITTKAPPKEPIQLNSAGPEQLAQLPGIGPVLAERIIQYRERLRVENGKGFEAKEQLLEVPGIGPKKYADLREYVRL